MRRSNVWVARRDWAVLRLDLLSASRDGVLMLTALLWAALAAALVLAGVWRAASGLGAIGPWLPTLLAGLLVTGPGGPAMIFGGVLIEEHETNVGAALRATPTAPMRLSLLRTVLVTVVTALWLLAATAAFLWSWPGAIPIAPGVALLTLAPALLGLSLLAGAGAIFLAQVARNRIEALAAFKGVSVLFSLPIALFFSPNDAWWRALLYVSPTGPAGQAVFELAGGEAQAALGWSVAALAYPAALFSGAVALSARR